MPEPVRIALQANGQSMIENRRWDRALIVGPAIIAPLENVQIVASVFDADPGALFLEVPEGKAVVGAVGLKNVVFSECRFVNVGVVGTSKSIASFREGFIRPQASHTPALTGRMAGFSIDGNGVADVCLVIDPGARLAADDLRVTGAVTANVENHGNFQAENSKFD